MTHRIGKDAEEPTMRKRPSTRILSGGKSGPDVSRGDEYGLIASITNYALLKDKGDRCNDGRLRIGHLIGETGLILSGCSPTFGSTATLAFSGVDGFGDALGDAMLRIGGDPVIG